MPNGKNEILFGNVIKSDGFCVNFLFYRRLKLKQDDEDMISIPNYDLELQDFTLQEIQKVYRPRFLNPGRKSVFTAAISLDLEQYQVRCCSIKEYYHFTGSTVYALKLQKRRMKKDITRIESEISKNISDL